MDYKAIWKTRKIQLLIINTACGAFGIFTACADTVEKGIGVWLIFSWIIGALVSSFMNESSLLSAFLSKTLDWGLFDAVSMNDKNLWKEAASICISLIKQLSIPLLVTVILVYAIISYPFVTVYYFVRAHNQKGRGN